MIALLEGMEEETQAHPVDVWRDALMMFINDYWAKISSQITCPAKSRDPKACYGCVDTQVYACITKNDGLLHHINSRRKT